VEVVSVGDEAFSFPLFPTADIDKDDNDAPDAEADPKVADEGVEMGAITLLPLNVLK
jgi:hypothetical protein